MRLNRIIYSVILVSFAALFMGCDAIDPQSGDMVDYSCEGCHTSKTALSGIIDDLDELAEFEGAHEAPG